MRNSKADGIVTTPTTAVAMIGRRLAGWSAAILAAAALATTPAHAQQLETFDPDVAFEA